MKILQNKNLRFLLLVAAILIVGVSIAYAVLSTTLTITFSKVTQNSIDWNVAFDTTTNPVEGTPAGTSATGRTCGDATVTANSVTVANSGVSKPGDKCTYQLSVKNTGSILARLAEINTTQPSVGGTPMSCTVSGASMVCNKITYKLTTDAAGTTLLATNSTIAASASQAVYLVVMYNDEDVTATAQTQTGASFSLVYNG